MDGEIRIEKKETAVELNGLAPDRVRSLRVYANKKTDLAFLSDYPRVEELILRGDFTDAAGLNGLHSLRKLVMYLNLPVDFSNVRCDALEILSARCAVDETFPAFFTENLRELELSSIRGLKSLSFLEQAVGLKKLYLNALPGVEALPDFRKLSKLFALNIYELHKLRDIESLKDSAVEYLGFTLAADKLSGTGIAKILLAMEKLKGADMVYMDRSSVRRYNVVENILKKEGREELLNYQMNYGDWKKL
ncbi:MAG: hypothetical protein HFG79_07540 [Lachnospiraceae bacterium]|jgi:hypothetical protein|nr:hypothetical protein [Lachnospiraceae bacterium]